MASFKHPVFAGAMIVLVLGVAAEGWFIYAEQQAAVKAHRQLETKRREWQAVAKVQPVPTDAVAAAIEGDLVRTTRAVAAMRASLTGSGPAAAALASTPVPRAPADAYFDIATFVERMRGRAEAAGVAVRPNERFGFAEFANTGPEPAQIAAVFRERLVAEQLLEALFAAQPRQLIAVARERPAAPAAAEASRAIDRSGVPDYFEVDPRVSARVPGFVQATAFRLTFTGQTAALRALLNKLAAFELPLVVRAVEVSPEAFDGRQTGDGTKGGVAPLVARSLSRFTVTVEYIELAPAKES